MNNFSDRLSTLLAGGTQAEFADRIGVHLNSLSSWVRGERYPSFEAVHRICTEYCVSADWLFGLSDVKMPSSMDSPSGPACPDCRRRDKQIDELFSQLRVLRSELQKKAGASDSQNPKVGAGVKKKGA